MRRRGGDQVSFIMTLPKSCSHPISPLPFLPPGDKEVMMTTAYFCLLYHKYATSKHFCVKIQSKENFLFFAEPSPPRFLVKNPRQLIVPIRGNATLTCSATGIPLPVIRWYKNGHPVPRSSATEFKGHSQLEFQAVGLRDQGKYWCEANSTEGWDRTSPTTLKSGRSIFT